MPIRNGSIGKLESTDGSLSWSWKVNVCVPAKPQQALNYCRTISQIILPTIKVRASIVVRIISIFRFLFFGGAGQHLITKESD